MQFAYFDADFVTAGALASGVKKLQTYRQQVREVVVQRDRSQSPYSLVHAIDPAVHTQLEQLKKQYKGIKHVVLVGIGGSSLGVEAVHAALGADKVQLHILDTIAPYQLQTVLSALKSVKNPKQIAVCVISKSGSTAETMVNAGVLLEQLAARYGKGVYQQTICIGNPGTDFIKQAKRLGATVVVMPEIVGGRFSVATEVGLVPLTLLGHDVDAFIGGLNDANSDPFEAVTAEQAVRLALYIKKNFCHYNFFAFEPRLEAIGRWYRQLQAESLGKTNSKKQVQAFVPTISTAVELHSVGQLYLAGMAGVYTDFVVFDDIDTDFAIPKQGLGKAYNKHTMQDVATGIYGGVMQAYQSQDLPYRSTIFDDDNLAYSLGLFMVMRMRETMYVAELLGVNAFDQPNVELYKTKTRAILNL